MKFARNVFAFALVAVFATALSACGSKSSADAVKVSISDAGCSPALLKLPAGAHDFEISASGSGKVTEYEILDGTRIIGERENITPGITSKFSLELAPGEYASYCPHGTKTEYGKVIVTGNGSTGGGSKSVADATAGYQKFVEAQTDELVKRTTAFVAAVKAGDVTSAKQQFAAAREPYEKIEPVAESFGTLDPEIDARENDVEKGQQWTGFHRIEKTLWQDNSTAGLNPIADKLLADSKELQKKAKGLTYQPAELANGSTGLLDEISKSKITGEEDRYSHTDLWDFAANVDGSQHAYKLLRPVVAKQDAQLASKIDARYAAVDSALANYRTANGFVLYTKLTPADTKKLSQAIDALGEPLSQVASKVTGQ
ncbi:MAG: iron uptake system protein EfeO [Solirubrobacterales bacterium]